MRVFRLGWFSVLLISILAGCTLAYPIPAVPSLEPDVEQTQMGEIFAHQPTATPRGETVLEPTAEPAASETPAATETLPSVEASATPEPEPTASEAAIFEPSATPSADLTEADPRMRFGAPKAQDNMDDGSGWLWPSGRNEFTSIHFQDGSLQLTGMQSLLGWRLANPEGKPLGNLYLEATIHTGSCKGLDQYGLIVHVPSIRNANQGYLVGLNCVGQYSLRSWDGTRLAKGSMTQLIDWTDSEVINSGAEMTNRVGVLVVDQLIRLYINGTPVDEIRDGSWTSGYFGVFVGASETPNFRISVDEMAYWENPQP